MRKLLATGCAAAVWIASWALVPPLAIVAVYGSVYWEEAALMVVVCALGAVGLAIGGPVVGIALGVVIWRRTGPSGATSLPPGWGGRPGG